MKPWNHASASQIKSFRRCPRKWWYEKIAGIERPDTPAMAFGRRVHRVAEAYLRGELGTLDHLPESGGSTVPVGHLDDLEAIRVFAAGREYLPLPPMPDDTIEQWVGAADTCEPFANNPDGVAIETPVVPLVGRADLILQTDYDGWVVDHKTTSDLGWALTPEELSHDPQAIIYTRHLLTHGCKIVFMRLVYYRTKGPPRSSMVDVRINREASDRSFAGIVHTLREMQECSHLGESWDVGVSRTACADYGGCPYAGRCATDTRRRGRQPSKEDIMGVMDVITSRKRVGSSNGASDRGVAGRQADAVLQVSDEPEPMMVSRQVDAAAGRLSDKLASMHPPSTPPCPPNPPDGTPPDVSVEPPASRTRGGGVHLPDGTPLQRAKKAELATFLEVPPNIPVKNLATLYGVDVAERTRTPLLRYIVGEVLAGRVERPQGTLDVEAPMVSSIGTEAPSVGTGVPSTPQERTSATNRGFEKDVEDKEDKEAEASTTRSTDLIICVDCAITFGRGGSVVFSFGDILHGYIQTGLRTQNEPPFTAELVQYVTKRLHDDLQAGALTFPRGTILHVSSHHPCAPSALAVLEPYASLVIRG